MTNMDSGDNNYKNMETLETQQDHNQDDLRNVTNDMGVTSDSLVSLYTKMMVDMRDPRTDGWFMMESIWPTIMLSATYYLIVRHIGPWFMSNR